MNNEEKLRAYYNVISATRNFLNVGETIIALAKEQIALLENHAGVTVSESAPDARVEQLKMLATMLGVKGDPQQWGIDRGEVHGEGQGANLVAQDRSGIAPSQSNE